MHTRALVRLQIADCVGSRFFDETKSTIDGRRETIACRKDMMSVIVPHRALSVMGCFDQ